MSKKYYNIAVVGATGVVGKELIETLEGRDFPVKSLKLLASERSVGMSISFKGEPIDIELLEASAFDGVDIALFSAGGSVSKEFCPIAAEKGVVCIDNTSHFRMEPNIPLVVPEVNAAALEGHQRIIANPNCSTAQLVVALKPLHDAATIERVVVSTYQSVSGAGKEAIAELEDQSRINLSGGKPEPKHFQYPIAFNVIPQIDVFQNNGYTKEEMKMILETQKILEDDSVKMTATTVRVPVFVGHSEAVNIQTKQKLTPDEVRNLLTTAPGIEVMDNPDENLYPTPRDVSGKDNVYVGRIREDISIENGIEFWCVGDNLRKGAALNAVQIAETLIQKEWV